MCLAEKILYVPNVNYIVRPRLGSIMRKRQDMAALFHESLRIYIDGFNELSRIMDGINFFVENADYRYSVLDWFVGTKLNRLLVCYEKNPPSALNMLVEKEFHSDDAFAAYIFNTLSIQRLKMIKLEEENRKLRENQKR
jgi:hypothetical protein